MKEQLLSIVQKDKGIPESPGPMSFIAGNMQLGYLGETTEEELISGEGLSSLTGFTSGSVPASYLNAGWLKFARNGKILYIAKRTMRSNMTWAQLNALNMVTGRPETIQGYPMLVRCLKGGIVTNDVNEWNDLMYRVCGQGSHPNVGAWANFTYSDISVTGSGGYSWCQETNPNSTTQRTMRGGSGATGVTTLFFQSNTTAFANAAWRPVLELQAS